MVQIIKARFGPLDRIKNSHMPDKPKFRGELWSRRYAGGCLSVTRLFWNDASALAVRAAGSTVRSSGAAWTFGAATSTSGDVMSGAGARVEVRICVGLGRWVPGRPTRWVVTIGCAPFSSVASVTNSNAISAELTTAKYMRICMTTLRLYKHLS